MSPRQEYRGLKRGGDHIAQCRSCRRPITWAITRNGKRMPMDAVPVDDGDWRIELVDGERRIVRIVPGGPELDPGVERYSSHFVTCPNADEHRRPR